MKKDKVKILQIKKIRNSIIMIEIKNTINMIEIFKIQTNKINSIKIIIIIITEIGIVILVSMIETFKEKIENN